MLLKKSTKIINNQNKSEIMAMDINSSTGQQSNKGGNIAGIIGAGAGAIGDIIGMIGQRKREKRAMRNQEHLMDVQMKNQQKLNQQGHDLQMQMWNDTNYGAQREHMEKAGLNVGMMYGGSGAGGSTTGSQGGGSATGGNAPAPQHMNIEAINSAMTMAQMELMKAQANKAEAEASSIRGEEGTQGATQIAEGQSRIAKAIEETNNEKIKGRLLNIEEGIKSIEKLYTEDQVANRTKQLVEEANQAQIKTWINHETYQDVIKEIQAKSIGQILENELTTEQINKIGTELIQRWSEIGIKEGELNLGHERLRIEKELRERGLNLEQQKIIVNGVLGVAGVSKLGGSRKTNTTKEKSDGSWEHTTTYSK